MIAIRVCKNRPEVTAFGSVSSPASLRRTLFNTAGIAAALCIGLLFSGCAKKEEKAPVPLRSVTATTAVARDLPLYVDSLGRTRAYESVQIVPQVNGTLQKIAFTQGTPVKKGDLLFEIDPALYQASVTQAEGALMQAKAQLSIDEKQLERSRSLLPDKLISEQEFQALEAKVESNKGAVKLAQGQLESAKVNLGYAVIVAPTDGLIGFYEVNEGNVVSAAAGTVLTSIQKLNPLYADFNVTDRDFISLREHFFAQGYQLPVVVSYLTGDGSVKRDAKLTVLGNEINQSTGTVRLRAQIANEDMAFWPEQPVGVRVILETLKDAVTIPTAAMGIGQMGKYVFIIEEDGGKHVVKQVPIKVGQTHDDGQTIIVTEGLKAGQRVVLDGQVFLQSGQEVVIADPSTQGAKGASQGAGKGTGKSASQGNAAQSASTGGAPATSQSTGKSASAAPSQSQAQGATAAPAAGAGNAKTAEAGK